jgi:hypothetical protein
MAIDTDSPKNAAIIGSGPAGLMAAEVLSAGGVHVDVYDTMPSAGRKFLLAGKGGLNLTHAEQHEQFLARYGTAAARLNPLLEAFGPDALRAWTHGLGINTFTGSSGRVFPDGMKAAPLLRACLHRLRQNGVHFHMRHRWRGWDNQNNLLFTTPQGEQSAPADAVILALGGGSWPQLGSDGSWAPLLAARGIEIKELRPSNCGFDVHWNEHFSGRFSGQPVKTVAVTFTTSAGNRHSRQGEFMITAYGVEGDLIYALSAPLRDEIAVHGQAIIHLDLMPDRTQQQLVDSLSQPRGKDSIASHLRKRAGIHGVKSALLREIIDHESLHDPVWLAATLKALPLTLIAPRPLAEAISTAGGVAMEALDERLMIKILPGVFCAGEMLDWEAPTGGYLLTACFATGRAAGLGVLEWLESRTV